MKALMFILLFVSVASLSQVASEGNYNFESFSETRQQLQRNAYNKHNKDFRSNESKAVNAQLSERAIMSENDADDFTIDEAQLSSHVTGFNETVEVTKTNYAKCFDRNNCSVVYYVVEQSGWFASPNFPNNYPPNSNVCWYFPYKGIIPYPSQFFFKEFCLDRNAVFTIYSETQFGPPSISYSHCRNTGVYFYPAPYPDLYFRFKSGKHTNGFQGFNVTFGLRLSEKANEAKFKEKTISGLNVGNIFRFEHEKKTTARCFDKHDCQNVQYLFDANGSFASPNYPERYPKNTNFCWYFPYNNMTNKGYQFSFEDICLDKDTTLSINSDRYGGTFKSYSGCSIKKGSFETPPYWDLYFSLKTKRYTHAKGFKITFKAK